MKAAIIGLGAIAPMHINALEAIGAEIVVRADKETHYNDLLARANFDALHICLPHFLHAEVAIAALEKGVHVLCEKPMATNVGDAQKMICAAEKSGAFLGVVFQNRFSPGAALIKNALESGELGTVKGGHIRVMWHRNDAYYESDWRGKIAKEGGGVLINQAIHMFDMANFFLGEPTDVQASIANRAHPKIEVEDVAEGVISYGAARVSFFVNTYHPYDAPATIELLCENGHAELSGENATIKFNDGRKKTAGPDTEAQKKFGMKQYWGVSHVKQIKAFYDCIKQGKSPSPNGAEALRTQKLINKIYDVCL
jgi:predicted dehydrogenase